MASLSRADVEAYLVAYGDWSTAVAAIEADHPEMKEQTALQRSGLQPGNTLLELLLSDIPSYSHTEVPLDGTAQSNIPQE